jgi:2-polyprenyl-3-methyl-5-hydroxy-6-metoxy-1,4-benzoquinol methylase
MTSEGVVFIKNGKKGRTMKDSKKFWDRQAKKINTESSKETEQLIGKSQQYLKAIDIVMDFGCGTGASTRGIAKYVKAIYGVDYSEEMIRVAKSNASNPKNVSFLATTIDDAQFSKGTFDVVVAYNVFHLLDDIDGIMPRIAELLKPNGILISNTPVIEKRKNIMTYLIQILSKIGVFPSVNLMKSDALKNKIDSFGFSDIESTLSSDAVPNLFLVSRREEA